MHHPAFVVRPVLTPSAPGYFVSRSFVDGIVWPLSWALGALRPSAGTSGCPSGTRPAGSCRWPTRTAPSASSPVTFTAWVFVRPRLAACWFISSANCASPPAMSMASMRAASLALTISIARIEQVARQLLALGDADARLLGVDDQPGRGDDDLHRVAGGVGGLGGEQLDQAADGELGVGLLDAGRNRPRRMS